MSPTPRPPAGDHSADSAASACEAKAPRSTRSRIWAGVAVETPAGSSPSAASRAAAAVPIVLAVSGSRAHAAQVRARDRRGVYDVCGEAGEGIVCGRGSVSDYARPKIVTPGGARAHRPPHTAPRGAFRGSKKKPLPIERGQDQTRLHRPLSSRLIENVFHACLHRRGHIAR